MKNQLNNNQNNKKEIELENKSCNQLVAKYLQASLEDLRKKQQEISEILHQVETNLSRKRHYNLKTIEDEDEYQLKEDYLILREDAIKDLDHEIYSKINKVETHINDVIKETEKELKKERKDN